ncbi:MAG: ROK family protein [Anaerolineales bacterium]|nr:ROK family protein [Anaerolineales bacterium]
MSIRIAVDLGGTHIRAAAYRSGEPRPLKRRKIKTRSEGAGIFERLLHLIEEVMPANKALSAIGVAAPGPLNPRTGVIIATPNIREWQDFPLAEKLKSHFGVPVYLGNDANLAALGEWSYGAGRGHNHLLYLTISTGVGGGVISAGHLLEGQDGLAAELGRSTVLADGPLCAGCKRGHLEALASGTAIANYVEEQLKDSSIESSLRSSTKRTAKTIAAAARGGDELAISAFARAGKYLGIGVAGFLHMFNPSVLIFGGGVTKSGDLLFTSFHAGLREQIFNPAYLENLIITTAALNDDSGLLGALALVEMRMKDEYPYYNF